MTDFNIEHIDPQKENRIARAPYNFVSLPYSVVKVDQNLPPHDRYDSNLYSGYIDCLIRTESPVYVGCAIKPESFRQNLDDEADKFFFTQDENIPVIPGSSIRGMIRNLVEIASFSKVAWVTNDKIGYRAVGDKTNFGDNYREQVEGQRAGYIHKQDDGWYIQPAKKIKGTNKNNEYICDEYIMIALSKVEEIANFLQWKFGGKKQYTTTNGNKKYFGVCDVYFDSNNLFKKEGKGAFRATKISFKEEKGYTKGMLIHSGYISGKHHDTIIGVADDTAKPIKIPDNVIKDYKAQLTDWQIQVLGENGVLKDKFPVFYKYDDKENMIVMFGHTLMFRMIYKNTPFEHIPPEVKDENVIDMVDAIFGYPSAKSNRVYNGYAGRVNFSDAVLVSGQKDVWLSDAFFPKILSGPKPSAFQHYLTQRNPDNIKSLEHYDPEHYDNVKEKMAAIRGHKLYWHEGKVELDDISEDKSVVDKKPDQYTHRISPVKSGVEFNSKIYFENLREEELGALLWVLNLPENCRHSIGMGKPYGMGAIKITPALYIEDKVKRYQKLFDDDKWMNGIKKEDMRNYIATFERFMMEHIDNRDKRDAENFTELKRISMLLKMLEWPGPDKNDTSYMDIKEFKERKVLPTPTKEKDANKTQPNKAKGYSNSQKGQANNTKNNNKSKYDNKSHNTSMADAFKKAGLEP